MELQAKDIDSYIRKIELPLRQKVFGHEAELVFRTGAFVGHEIEWCTVLPRAMERAREQIDRRECQGGAVKSGKVILAGALTGPKGRFRRVWHAPEGGLWGCLVHASTLSPPATMLLSLAVGVAACEALVDVGVDHARLRWVNDVLAEGEKIAGFLIESHSGPISKEQFHLVGFGINVNNDSFPHELEGNATSIKRQLGRSCDLHHFSSVFIAKLRWNLGLLHYHEFFKDIEPGQDHPILASWKSLSDSIGQRVVFGYDVMEEPQYKARVIGLTESGGLLLGLGEGQVATEYSGEIRYLAQAAE